MAPAKEIKKRQCLTCFHFYEPSKRCKQCFWVGQRLNFDQNSYIHKKFFFDSHPWNSIDVAADTDHDDSAELFEKTQLRKTLKHDTETNDTDLPDTEDETDDSHESSFNQSPLNSPKVTLKQWITVNERFDHIVRQKRNICNSIVDHYSDKISLLMPNGAEFLESNGRLTLQIPVGKLAQLMADVCDLWDVHRDGQSATTHRRGSLPSDTAVERE